MGRALLKWLGWRMPPDADLDDETRASLRALREQVLRGHLAAPTIIIPDVDTAAAGWRSAGRALRRAMDDYDAGKRE